MSRPVFIRSAGVFCAAGASLEAVWQSALSGAPSPSALPFGPLPGGAFDRAFLVDEPPLSDQGVDRRVLRTMEKQGRIALYGAALALNSDQGFASTDKTRYGLYLGLPMVDDPVPPWPVLQAMHQQGLEQLTTELCLHETPPFSALSDLNSTAGAQIAACFGMTGAMGFNSPGADAGLQAVIEAALSIAEGENEAALAGAVAPKVNPLLPLQFEHFGWLADQQRRPGEGAALMTLSTQPLWREDCPDIHLSGYARGFTLDGPVESCRADIRSRAMSMAGLRPADSLWEFPCELLWPLCGDLGPAAPVLALLLAAHGLRRRRQLAWLNGGFVEQALDSSHAVVTVQGAEGQCVAVVLSREAR